MAKRRAPRHDSIALAVREESSRPSSAVDTDEREQRAAVSPVVIEARERWQQCQSAESTMRASMLEAKKFRAGNQWPEEIKIQRQGGGSVEGQAAQPPRPCLTIDRLSQPVRQISNSIRTANFAIQVIPNGAGADEQIAKIYEGIVRKIQTDSRDEAPVEWAAEGAIEAGLGWFRIRPVYCHNDATTVGAEAFDMELTLERITNSLTVYCDPHAKKPTRADARFMFVTEDISHDEFKRRFDTADYASLEEFSSTGDLAQWVTDKTVRVSEYWRIEDEMVTVAQLPDGRIVSGADIPDGQPLLKVRQVAVPHVKMSVINAMQELSKFDWPGSHIPLIPIIGEELNVDGQVLLRGVIQEGMDAQRMVNYMYSAAIETVALAPKAPFIVADGQIDEYKQIWQNANRFNYAYLPYTPTALNGTPVGPPNRQDAEPPIQAMVLMLAKSEDAIKATTGLWDASLGNMPGRTSGRGIRYLQQQGEMGSSNFPDNIHRALVYAGEQLIEVIPKYYDRPGRVLHILGENLETQSIMVQPGAQQQPPMNPELMQGMQGFFDPNAGKYAVSVEVGKGFATKRQESAAILGDMITGLPPEIAAAVTPAFIRMMDFPNAQEIADAAQRALPPQLQPKSQQPDPAALQAQLAQMGQQLQELQPLADKNHAELMKVQFQQQEETKRTAMELQSKKEIAIIQQTAQILKTDAKLDAENARTQAELIESYIDKALGLHVDKIKQLMEHGHAAGTQAADHAHEAGMQAADHAHELTLAATQAANQPADSEAQA